MTDSELSRALSGEGALPHSPPSRHPSLSLQAAATLNAGLQRESPSRGSPNSPLSPPGRESPSTDRRRSQVLMNLQIADPTVPSPGEMVAENHNGNSSHQSPTPHPVSPSPRLIATGAPHHHHNRTPSLGELHQELENEQEYQVNRLLAQIRQLQEQVQRQQQQHGANPSTSAVDETPAPPGAGFPAAVPTPPSTSLPRSPGFPRHPRGSFDLARGISGGGTDGFRLRSRTPSRHASPRLRSTSIGGGDGAGGGDQFMLSGRDEAAFYQAETASLMRENQMLRHRIQVLEHQLSTLQGGNTSLTHEPSQASHLNRSMSVAEVDSGKPESSASQSSAMKAE